MFRYKLSLVLALLLSFILAQAGAAYWSNKVATDHIQRGQTSNQILQHLMQLGTEKQQLKIWLAEYLLLKDGSTLKRDVRFQTLDNLLSQLNQLTAQAQQHSLTTQDFAEITQQIKVIYLFETNLERLKNALRSWDIAKIHSDDDRWTLISQTFDRVEDTDLRQLIDQAITLQKERTERYEQTAVDALSMLKIVVLSLASIGVLLGAMLGVWLLRTLSKPLAALVQSTTAIEQGNLSHRIEESGPTELKILAKHFNHMAVSLEQAQKQELSSRQLIETEVEARTKALAQALESLEKAKHQQKEFFANVSHELRTPATAILGEAQVTLRNPNNSPMEYQQALQRINESAGYLAYRIEDLLMLVRHDEKLFQPTRVAMSLQALWHAVVRQAQLLVKPQQVELRIEAPNHSHWEHLNAYMDLDKLLMVIRIIVDNALRYDPQKHPLSLTLTILESHWQIQLYDQGIGIQADDLPHIFQRYFRAENGKRARPDGLGIGLTLAHSICQQLGGCIVLTSQTQIGTTASLTFPLEEDGDI